MPFSEEPKVKSYDETQKRTGVDYAKFTPDYRTVLRILNPTAKTVWKHFIPSANAGRGSGAVCPNVTADLKICPIEASAAHLPKDAQERKDSYARRKFVVNVLDRTPHTTCPTCGTLTPGKVNAATRAKTCVSCGDDLKKADFAPLNKVKILESGPQLFNNQLNVIEQMQKEELDDKAPDITYYDITFTAQGVGRDRTITAMPQDPKPLEDDALLDKETGETQELYSLETLAEPASVEVIELMLQGATTDQINAVRGII